MTSEEKQKNVLSLLVGIPLPLSAPIAEAFGKRDREIAELDEQLQLQHDQIKELKAEIESSDKFQAEAAELYAESRAKDAWERACDAQISSINDSIKNQWVRDFGKMMDDDAERDGYFICGFVQEALKNNKPPYQP